MGRFRTVRSPLSFDGERANDRASAARRSASTMTKSLRTQPRTGSAPPSMQHEPVTQAGQGSEYLSTLERGLAVLRAFDHDHPEMQLSEVAAITELSPAVARRCLNTLVQLGYVAKHGRRFLLRPEVLVFGSAFMSSMNLETVALPALQRLRDETGDSSSMAVLSGHDILYVAHVSTNRHIRVSANVGTRFPLHATSLGKVLLAFQGEEAIEAYFKTATLDALYRAHADRSRRRLRARLARARADGLRFRAR